MLDDVSGNDGQEGEDVAAYGVHYDKFFGISDHCMRDLLSK